MPQCGVPQVAGRVWPAKGRTLHPQYTPIAAHPALAAGRLNKVTSPPQRRIKSGSSSSADNTARFLGSGVVIPPRRATWRIRWQRIDCRRRPITASPQRLAPPSRHSLHLALSCRCMYVRNVRLYALTPKPVLPPCFPPGHRYGATARRSSSRRQSSELPARSFG